MTCKRCGAAMAADAVFCPNCGQKAEAPSAMSSNGFMAATGFAKPGDLGGGMNSAPRSAAPANNGGFTKPAGPYSEPTVKSMPTPMPRPAQTPPVAPAPQPVRAPGKYCPNCGNALAADARFCNVCGTRMDAAPAPTPVQAPVASVSANVTGKVKETIAVEKTKTAGMSKGMKYGLLGGGCAVAALLFILLLGAITNWFGLSGPATKIASATMKTFGAKSLTADFVFEIDGDEMAGTAQIRMNPRKRELTAYIEMDLYGDDVVIAIYDDYLIFDDDYGCYKQSISRELEDFFDAYEEGTTGKFSWEDTLDEINEDAYDEASDYIDFEILEKCLRTYVKSLNNKKWLKENAGYSTDREKGVKLHVFDCDVVSFINESVDFFEDAFRDEDDFDELCEVIDEIDYYGDVDINLQFGVKGGKLVKLVAETDTRNDDALFSLEVNFSKIGSTRIDTDMLAELLDDAR